MSTPGAPAAGRTPAKNPGRRSTDSGAHQTAAADAATTGRDKDDSMNVDAIKQILDLVREHELTEFELEQAGVKLRVRKQGAVPAAAPAPVAVAAPAPAAPVPAATPPPVAAAPAGPAAEPIELSVVTSPIVGTFYRSPDPSSASFVEVGQRVKKGQTLCIIEAMKLMNEIESEYEGEIVKIYVENGQPVQYGERLFAVKTT
jgi:acetyl-CoA carboxylase biotin carboxyl carrier protein